MSKHNHYGMARELLAQIKEKKIQVLSRAPGSKRDLTVLTDLPFGAKSRNTKNFIMNVLDAQCQSAIYNHRSLLQQLMDTAMVCQQCVFECARAGAHSSDCERCNLAGITSNICFTLAKSLFSTAHVAPQLPLHCADACEKFVAFLEENRMEEVERYIEACQRLADACRNLYKKIGSN